MNELEMSKTLRGMAVETGSLVCLGCGHERSCSTHGCAILKDAADTVERLVDQRAKLLHDASVGWVCYSCKLREKGREWLTCKNRNFVNGPEGTVVCANWRWRGNADDGV